MLQQHKISSNTARLSWPDECKTIVRLSPLLLAGMSGNRSKFHDLIRSTSNMSSEFVDLQNLKAQKLLAIRKKATKNETDKFQSERTIIHSKKLHEELIMPPIPQTIISTQDQDKFNDKVNSASLALPQSQPKKRDFTRGINRANNDCIYTFDIQDSKESSKNVIKKDALEKEDELFTDDRYFTRSYYNRKNEKDIYSKPPNMRRVMLDIRPSNPEYGTDQSWITSWEPQNEFLTKSIKNISLKASNDLPIKRFPQPSSKKPAKKVDYPKVLCQKVQDLYCSYTLPKRQEITPLNGDFVARLVEIQTGHVAHRHRKMRPTLGVSKLQKKTRLIHIGPSTKHMNHNDMNEDPDDLDLALQICNLSLEEKTFTQDLSNLTHKLQLSYIRANNKRKKKSSHLFRTLQSNVESIVNSETSNITETLRYKMGKFLQACKKDQIFLETIGDDYNPWEQNIQEIQS